MIFPEPGRIKAITSTKRGQEHTAQSEDLRQLFVLTSSMGRPEPTVRSFSYLYSVYLLIPTELVSIKDHTNCRAHELHGTSRQFQKTHLTAAPLKQVEQGRFVKEISSEK